MEYDYLDTKIGVIKICYKDDILYELKFVKTLKPQQESKFSKHVKKQLENYFNFKDFDFNFHCHNENTKFQNSIYNNLKKTNIGQLLSYKELGVLANSNAIRAIGSAMAANKFPIIIPCHRVIKSDGTWGNYTGGVTIKNKLILHELEWRMKDRTKEHIFSQQQIDDFLTIKQLAICLDTIKLPQKYTMYKNNFECLISQIIYQVVNFNTGKNIELKVYNLFDFNITPEKIIAVQINELRQCGLSTTKINYCKNVANYFILNNQTISNINKLTNQEIYNELILITGVGKWTIEMFLIFGLGRDNVFSFDDFVLANMYKKIFCVDVITSENKTQFLDLIFGFETLASITFWEYYKISSH